MEGLDHEILHLILRQCPPHYQPVLARVSTNWRKACRARFCEPDANDVKKRCLRAISDHGLAFATILAKRGELALFRWALDQGCCADIPWCFTKAVKHGHLNMARWLSDTYDIRPTNDHLQMAVAGNHVGLVEWMLGRPSNFHHHRKIEAKALPSEAMLMLVVQHLREPVDVVGASRATLRWLMAKGLCDCGRVLTKALARGDTDLCSWLVEQGTTVPRPKHTWAGNGIALSWLRCRGAPISDRLMAVRNSDTDRMPRSKDIFDQVTGDGGKFVLFGGFDPLFALPVDLVRYYVESGKVEVSINYRVVPVTWDRSLLDRAISNRSPIDVLQSLYDAGLECDARCAQRAMERGRVKVMEWCHSHGCDTAWFFACPRYIEDLVARGKVAALQWLYEKGPLHWSDPTASERFRIPSSNAVATLQWLKDRGCSVCPEACLDQALKRDAWEVVLWLRAKYPDDVRFGAFCINKAACHGSLATIKHLRALNVEWTDTACYEALERRHYETFYWLLSNGCPCYEHRCSKQLEGLPLYPLGAGNGRTSRRLQVGLGRRPDWVLRLENQQVVTHHPLRRTLEVTIIDSGAPSPTLIDVLFANKDQLAFLEGRQFVDLYCDILAHLRDKFGENAVTSRTDILSVTTTTTITTSLNIVVPGIDISHNPQHIWRVWHQN
ncbi:hypothetical protein [Mollivirus kamchatka]|nr:hypothetical protein [Mollivirus kamchatka]